VGGVIDCDQPVASAAGVKPRAAHEREAQRAEHPDITDTVAPQSGSDPRDLPLERVELPRAVTAVYEQHLAALDDSGPSELYRGAAALAVDHRHAAGSDRDVVDVRSAAARDPAVVQDHHVAAVKAPRERSRGRDLSLSALPPRLNARGIAAERRKNRTEDSVTSRRASAARRAPLRILALRAASGPAVGLDRSHPLDCLRR